METKTIRKRVLANLGKLHYSTDVYQNFSAEQKKARRKFKKFWEQLQSNEKLMYELLFLPHKHSYLSGPTFRTLIYSFAKSYFGKTNSKELKDYANALMGKYEYGYEKFDGIIRQKELKLINFILEEIPVNKMCEDRQTQLFMRQALTLLVISSEMKYDAKTEEIIDHMLDEFEEGRAEL